MLGMQCNRLQKHTTFCYGRIATAIGFVLGCLTAEFIPNAAFASECPEEIGKNSPNQVTSIPTTRTTPAQRQDIAVALLRDAQNERELPAENIIFSQASLDTLLALVGLGYDRANRTLLEGYLGGSLEEIAARSGMYGLDDSGVTLLSASNLWSVPEISVKPGYLEEVSRLFDGLNPGVLNVHDAQATANIINEWIGARTNNILGEVVAPSTITPDLVMILVNALYFKGTWQTQFDPAMTEDATFHAVSLTGKVKEVVVPTMEQMDTQVQFSFDRNDRSVSEHGMVHLRLPYEGGKFAMYISFAAQAAEQKAWDPVTFRPQASADIAAVYKNAVQSEAAFNAQYQDLDVDRFTMPKFKITTLFDILATLKMMGYSDLAQPGALAKLTDDPRAFLSFVFQKATIIVNEEGSEAAAATVAGVALESLRPANPSILLDGPFSFAIRNDSTGTTLFEGIVRNPAEE